MINRKKGYRVAVTVSIALMAVVLVCLWSRLYTVSRESVINNAGMELSQHTKEIDYLLQKSGSELSLTSDMIDDMIRKGKTNDDILDYLTAESKKTIAVFEGNSTGMYGYIQGEYLDGAGWVPEEDYDPTERPWYTAAAGADGELTFVEPYLDAQTGTVIMTVSRLLSDKRSVVAFDVNLFPIQELIETIASETGAYMLVLTDTGFVVSFSEAADIGSSLARSENALLQALDDKLRSGETDDFELSFDGDSYFVFCRVSYCGWRTFAVLRSEAVGAAWKGLAVSFAAVLLLVAIATGFVVLSINARLKKEEELNEQLQSLANIYICMYELDLIGGGFHIRKEAEHIAPFVRNASGDPLDMVSTVLMQLTTGVAGKEALRPADTIAELAQLQTADMLTKEVETVNGWIRERFIVVDRKGTQPWNVLWVLEDIDEKKRREEHLVHEVLYDEMTGLLNRKAYEQHLKAYENTLPEADLVYITLDVNHLKYTNDKYGHHAGDELLKGAAECINECFSAFGRAYRTGGDEFAVIFFADQARLDEMLQAFIAAVDRHNGATGEKLAVAYGYASAAEFPDTEIIELAKIADDRMYRDKHRYYMRTGFDRR